MGTKSSKRRNVRSARASTKRLDVARTINAKARKTEAGPTTKLSALIAALRAPKGATITQLVAITGWQKHSIRGAMSGVLKKKRGLSIISTKSGDERTYRIEGGK